MPNKSFAFVTDALSSISRPFMGKDTKAGKYTANDALTIAARFPFLGRGRGTKSGNTSTTTYHKKRF